MQEEFELSRCCSTSHPRPLIYVHLWNSSKSLQHFGRIFGKRKDCAAPLVILTNTVIKGLRAFSYYVQWPHLYYAGPKRKAGKVTRSRFQNNVWQMQEKRRWEIGKQIFSCLKLLKGALTCAASCGLAWVLVLCALSLHLENNLLRNSS